MRKSVIGVMGPGAKASPKDVETAFELGKLIAQNGWILLSGGRAAGVMDAVNKGAKSAGGLTIGISPEKDASILSESVDIGIVTGMGSARNAINVLTSDVVIGCGEGGAGTASEIALALKSKKNVVLVGESAEAQALYTKLGGDSVHIVNTPEQAIMVVKHILTSL